MKSYLLLLFTLAVSVNAGAQNWINDIQKHNVNFYTVQKEFNDWKSTHPDTASLKEEYEDITEQYYRWENFWRTRINYDGSLPAANKVVSERKKYMATHNHTYRSGSNTSNWQPLTYSNTNDINDVGRIDCIAISPTDLNTIWAGSPTGGLWKSIDGGISWSTNTDTLASLGISDIVYDPQQPNIMYLATGNRDDANGGGSTFSVGVLKSSDGGQTWKTTGLDWSLSNSASVIKRLVMDPANHNILYAAVISDVYSYVYKTTDAGVTWNVIYTTASANARLDVALMHRYYTILSVAYLDQDNGTVQINTSLDGGNSFIGNSNLLIRGAGTPNNIKLATTPADSNYLYVLITNQQDFNCLYLSKDGGFSFSFQCDSPNILGYDCHTPGADGQAFYDVSIAASPVNGNELTVGGINIWQSKDTGKTWTPKSCWTGPPLTHSDQHYTLYSPFNAKTIYQGCDGGIYKSTNDGNTWNAISANMKTTQFYGGDISEQNADNVIGGAQDNGSILITQGGASQIQGGDGGSYTFFNYNNDNIFFYTVNGSPKGIVNATYENCGMGDFQINPLNANSYFTYANGVYKSFDNAATFNLVTPNVNPLNNFTHDVKMTKADSNVLFAIINFQLYRISGKDGNPVLISGNLPSVSIYTPQVTDYCVSDEDTNKIWLLTSGLYNVPTNRVYYTSNGGATWTNISGSLPDVPYNNIILENNANNSVYLATDMGVFYKSDLLSDWVNWSTGLPNTIISQLKINYTANQLLAVTFGRSMFETGLYAATGIEQISANPVSAKIYPNPNNGNFTLQLKNALPNAQLQIFNMLGKNCFTAKLNSANTPVTLNNRADGIYLYRILSQNNELISSGKFVVGR